MQVLMVCHGNICRSPMAAAVTTALLEEARLDDTIRVGSAGTSAEHTGEDMDPRARKALRRDGWPAPHHRARQLARGIVEPGALVLCADRANLRVAERLSLDANVALLRPFERSAPLATGNGALGRRGATPDDLVSAVPARRAPPGVGWGEQEIPDPWYGGGEDFDAALRIIEQACRGLVVELAGRLSAPSRPSVPPGPSVPPDLSAAPCPSVARHSSAPSCPSAPPPPSPASR